MKTTKTKKSPMQQTKELVAWLVAFLGVIGIVYIFGAFFCGAAALESDPRLRQVANEFATGIRGKCAWDEKDRARLDCGGATKPFVARKNVALAEVGDSCVVAKTFTIWVGVNDRIVSNASAFDLCWPWRK